MTAADMSVPEIYKEVIENVIRDVRELFLANNVEEQILEQLKRTWEAKVFQTNAICGVLEDLQTAPSEDHVTPALSKIELTPKSSLPQQVAASQLQGPAKDEKEVCANNSKKSAAPRSNQEEDKESRNVKQLDGSRDTSDSDDDDSGLTDDGGSEENDTDIGPQEPPINSDDNITDEDPSEAFETENIVVCQYSQVIRRLNKWRLYLKSGIMNHNGEEHFFEWAYGEAEW